MKLLSLSFILFLCSCASLRSEQEQLKASYELSQFDEAIKVITTEKFKDKENKLLQLIEMGSIKFYQNKLLDALEAYKQAQTLAEQLYTKSIKEMILSGFVGDDAKSFYGKIYERSAIFHMQVRIMLELSTRVSLTKSERKKFLLQARSAVLAWNSFYESLQREDRKNFFTHDYHQALLSALIHENVGKRSDINTALILYKNTLRDINKLIALYPAFNSSFEPAMEQYLAGEKIKAIKHTPAASELIEFIKFKILYLTKKHRKYAYKKQRRKLKPSKNTLTKLQESGSNVTLVLSKDFLDVMQTKVISYNLNRVLDNIDDPGLRTLVEVIGVSALTYFTLGTLGVSSYQSYNGGRYVYRHFSAGNELVKNVGIEVKVPYTDAPAARENLELEVLSEDGSVAQKQTSLDLFNSYQEKKYLSTRQFANKYYNTVGVKIALKYLVAIVAAYQTHKQLEESGNPLASTFALAQFLVTTKAISATQSVDTRHWVGLKKNSFFANLNLSPGKYIVRIKVKSEEKAYIEKTIEILKGGPSLFFL